MGWARVAYSLGRKWDMFFRGSSCHSNPYPWVLLEHSYHHQDELLPTMTPPVKGANNVASTSRRIYRVVRMVVFARFRSAAPYQNHDPTTVPDP